jgi:hypothetical protein
LDPLCSDNISIRFIGTYFALLNSKVCSNSEESKIRKETEKFVNLYEEETISKEVFVKIPMWFDGDQDSPTLQSILILIT